jgi:DNA-binding transcriptional MerR regulator
MAMDKKQLSQLRFLNKEIELLQKEIDETKCAIDTYTATDVVKGSDSEWPYIRRTFRIEGISIPEYEKRLKHLYNKLEHRLKDLMKKREEIEEYIATVPDSEMRVILTLRYIEGLSWQQIATRMGVVGDGSTERKKHDRFLKFSQIS